MKKVWLLVGICAVLCAVLLTGCGCSNEDTNDDGIVGNDNATQSDNEENDKNDTTGSVAEDSMDAAMDAADGVGNAAENIGRGANNVMHDVSDAARNMVR